MPQLQPPPYQDQQGTQRWSEWFRKINNLLSSLSISIGGADDVTITPPVANKEILVWDGSSTWQNQTGTEWGIVNDTTPQLGGALDMQTNNITGTGNLVVGDGTAALPAYRFTTDANNGMYLIAANVLGLSAGGQNVFRMGNSYVRINTDGNLSNPCLQIGADANTGLYQPANDQFAVSAGGVEQLRCWGTYVDVKNQVMGPTTAVTAATHTMADGDRYLLCDTTSNAITVDLLTAATAGDGYRLDVKIVNATNTVTIDGNGTETIDGGLTLVLSNLYDNVSLVCDGSNWHIL